MVSVNEMEYRIFGKTGWKVSEIGLGGSWFYGRPEMGLKPVSHGVAVVERALELGVNYFDTAPLYGRGRSEEVLGVALSGVREPYYLATKVGYYPEPFDYTRDSVWRGLDASLKRLKRDHVHLLQVHEAEKAGWPGLFDAGQTIEALLEIQSQGICDYIGLTGSDLDLMSRVLKETDVFVSVITFCKYDLLTQRSNRGVGSHSRSRRRCRDLRFAIARGVVGFKTGSVDGTGAICRFVRRSNTGGENC